jgi:hypothetical protein
VLRTNARRLLRLKSGIAVQEISASAPANACAGKQHLLVDLRLALPRRHWSLLERVRLEENASELRLVCSVADRGLVEAHLLPVLRAQCVGGARVVTRGAAGQVTPLAAEATPPDWIAPHH